MKVKIKIGFVLGSCLLVLLTLSECGQTDKNKELPVLGRERIVEKEVDGVLIQETVPHKIADFEFVDQDSSIITNDSFSGQVYVADFFFTSCPTICPIMKRELLRVYEAYENDPRVAILSHSIDPTHDTVALLHEFAQNLGVKSDKWHFVTGDKDKIFEIAEQSYMVVANEDLAAPGGFAHSGAFLLVDEKRRIRGVYDGTVPDQVNQLIVDIKKLVSADENT